MIRMKKRNTIRMKKTVDKSVNVFYNNGAS